MRSPQPALLLVLVGVIGAVAPAPATRPIAPALDDIRIDALRAYVETLAGDDFRGRGVGDVGNQKAETYVCDTLTQAGVTPAGAEGSCYQPVDVYRPTLGPGAHLTVRDEDGSTLGEFAAGPDFYPLPETGDRDVTAPLVQADGGVGDAVALVSTDGDPDPQVAAALLHGALGAVVVGRYLPQLASVWPARPSVREATYRLMTALRSQPAPIVTLSQPAARPIEAALRAGHRLSATLSPALVAEPLRIHNVLGVVEGRDSRHRHELVVVGAHLDHDGVDDAGRIYHGADDNASGTAAVMAGAAAFAQAAAHGERPARAVLFALWNGEEKGELGAEAFVEAGRPGRRVIANINLDMVGRHEEVPDPDDWRFTGFPKIDAASSTNTLHVLGYSYTPELAADVRQANGAVGLSLKEDYDVGAQDLLHRSDQWPFLRHGIPAVYFTTGLHPDYHTPSDEPARIDFGKLERVARLAARTAWIVAERGATPIKRQDQ
ncbi:MAG TPA: M28 family peptidase [Vicinamibacterales bacterium]